MDCLIDVFEAFIYHFASIARAMEGMKNVIQEGRRWEDLGEDCLINVFGRLGLKDKTLGVPFVCKSWYKASLNPLSWRVLNFHQLRQPLRVESWGHFAWRFHRGYRLKGRFSFSGLLKFAVSRSDGLAMELILPEYGVSFADMVYVSDKCPALKVLVLPDLPENSAISTLISKWKDLERLYLRQNRPIKDILLEISRKCENLTTFQINYSIDKEASYILTYLPKLKYLCLSGSRIEKESLMVILKGCKGLEELYLRNVNYFDDEVLTADKEVVTEASSIKTFKYAKLLPPLDCDNEYPYKLLEYGGSFYMSLSIQARTQQLEEEKNRLFGQPRLRHYY